MRRLRMAMLLGSATLLMTGCSAGRTISNPFAAGHASVQSSGTAAYVGADYASEYENDPVGQPGRVAIDPQPVPPARGISLTKQISLTTTVGHRRRIDGCTQAPTCVAPVRCAPTCVAPPQCVPQNHASVCKGRGLFGKLWPFHCRQHQGVACAPQQGCISEPSCCIPQQSCVVEPSCSIPQASCCIPQSVCVPHSQCVPQYAQPLSTGCAVEGCDQGTHGYAQDGRRGLIGRLFCCLTRPCRKVSPGTYCPPACSAPIRGHRGCVTEGCGPQSYAMAPTDHEEPVGAYRQDCSPLADLEEDPFAEPALSADQETDARTPVPNTPNEDIQEPLPPSPPVGKPLQADDIPAPPQPADVPLQPSAGEPQVWIEPGPWKRLQTPSWNPVVIQPRSLNNTQPTSWPRR